MFIKHRLIEIHYLPLAQNKYNNLTVLQNIQYLNIIKLIKIYNLCLVMFLTKFVFYR